MFGRNFTLEVTVDDEQKTNLADAITDADRLVKTMGLAAVRFKWGGLTYTVCADKRVIQTIPSNVHSVIPTKNYTG